MRIKITELSSRTITRGRGSEAYSALVDRMPASGIIEIEIPADSPISLSFLDEIIRSLAADNQLARVRFLTSSDDAAEKLSTIKEVRKLKIETHIMA